MNAGRINCHRLRNGFVAAALWGSVCVSIAAPLSPPSVEDSTAAQFHQMTMLREAVLDLSVKRDRLDHQSRFLDQSKYVAVFLAAADGVRLSGIEIGIDGATPTTSRKILSSESDALQRNTRLRVMELALSPGTHQLVSDVTLIKADGTAGEAPIHLEQTVQKADSPLYLVLSATSGSTFSPQSVTLSSLVPASDTHKEGWVGRGLTSLGLDQASDQFSVGGKDDPRIQLARFQQRTDQRLSAVVTLLGLAEEQSDGVLDPAYLRTLIEALIEYGAANRAAKNLIELDRRSTTLSRESGRLHLQLAQLYYRQHLLDESLAQTELVQKGVGTASPEVDDLIAKIDLADGRFGDAESHLSSIPNDADYGSYVRYYNLGVALIRNGSIGQGETVLNRVGKLPRGNLLLDRVADQANLVLGYHFLRQQQGGTAAPVLERISSDGPFASRALLGLGWSWLAPQGEKVTQVARGDEIVVSPPPEDQVGGKAFTTDRNLYKRFDLSPFVLKRLSPDLESRRKHALAIWSQLLDRDPTDPAVAEGLAAVAVTLDELGAHEDAVRYLNLAEQRFETIGTDIRRAMASVRDDRWISNFVLLSCKVSSTTEPGVEWELRALPPEPLASNLRDALAEETVQVTMQNYCEALLLRRQLKLLAADGPPSVDTTSIDELKQEASDRQQASAANVERERNRLKTLLTERLTKQADANLFLQRSARYSLGRAYDGKSISTP